jgi:hypothetical protein
MTNPHASKLSTGKHSWAVVSSVATPTMEKRAVAQGSEPGRAAHRVGALSRQSALALQRFRTADDFFCAMQATYMHRCHQHSLGQRKHRGRFTLGSSGRQ